LLIVLSGLTGQNFQIVYRQGACWAAPAPDQKAGRREPSQIKKHRHVAGVFLWGDPLLLQKLVRSLIIKLVEKL